MKRVCALLLLAGLATCGDKDEPNARSSRGLEQNRREDFLWSDRLSVAPSPAPVATVPSPEWQQRVIAATWDDLDPLVGALPRGDASVRCALEAALAPELPAVTRAIAATCLGHLGDPAAAGALCIAIGDGEPTVQVAALRSLGMLRVPWTMPRLIKVFGRYVNHPNLLARVEAAAALLKFQNVAGIPLCIKVLKEHTRLEDNANREWARSSRVALEKESALAALVSLTGDDFGYSADAPLDAQERAIVAFDAWWSEHGEDLVRAQPAPTGDAGLLAKVDELVQGLDVYQVSTADDARFVLARLGPAMFSAYVRRLSDSSIYVRSHLLDVIAEIAPYAPSFDAETRAGLDTAIKDPAAAVRTQAIRVFGALRRADLLPQLAASLQDSDGSVRVAAARALGDARLDGAVAILAPVVARPQHDELWAAAVLSSIRLGQTALATDLLQMLVADEVVDQSAALDALGELGAPIGGFPLGGARSDRAAARAALETWLGAHPPSHNASDRANEGASNLK